MDMPGTEAGKPVSEWTCGHQAHAICGQCYLALIRKANELMSEVCQLIVDKAKLEEARIECERQYQGKVAEIGQLVSEVAEWKERWQAERDDHERTMAAWDKEGREL